MTKRKSLAQKLDYCAQHGALNFYTHEEAVVIYDEMHDALQQEDWDALAEAYAAGMVLCHFRPLIQEDWCSIRQLNKPSEFIIKVVHLLLT